MNSLRLLFFGVLLAVFPASAAEPSDEGDLPGSGVNLSRARGGWLNVTVEGNRLAMTFFDAKKKPIPPDVIRAVARVNYSVREDQRVVLNPDGNALKSPPKLRAPHVFRVSLLLFADGSSEPVESHVFGYPAP